MRQKICNKILGLLLTPTFLPLAAQSLQPVPEVKHYGYSGADKMLACIQQTFGKYAAEFPHTVLYGSPPRDTEGMRIVNGHWEQVTDHISFPPVPELPCPATRDQVAEVLQEKVAKLLTVPEGEPDGIRLFETSQWVYIIPASKFDEVPGTPDYPSRQRWKRIRIGPRIEATDGITPKQAELLIPEILKYARVVPLEPSQEASAQELAAQGLPQRDPKSDDEVEIGPSFKFYKARLKENAPESVIAIEKNWPWETVGRLIYGEMRDGKYQVLWDSPLLNGLGRLDLVDVNGDGWDELLWRSATCGAQNCEPQELTIFDKDGKEITRQHECYVRRTYLFDQSDGVCAIVGNAINVNDLPLAHHGTHKPADITVKHWAADNRNHVFRLADGLYLPGPPLPVAKQK